MTENDNTKHRGVVRQRDELAERIARLETAFRHVHMAVSFGSDQCSRCPLDIRDPIHMTSEEFARNG